MNLLASFIRQKYIILDFVLKFYGKLESGGVNFFHIFLVILLKAVATA